MMSAFFLTSRLASLPQQAVLPCGSDASRERGALKQFEHGEAPRQTIVFINATRPQAISPKQDTGAACPT